MSVSLCIYMLMSISMFKLPAQLCDYSLIDSRADMNTTRSQRKWLWQYLQKEYQQKMCLLTLVNRLYVYNLDFLSLPWRFPYIHTQITIQIFLLMICALRLKCIFVAAERYYWCSWSKSFSLPVSIVWKGIPITHGSKRVLCVGL